MTCDPEVGASPGRGGGAGSGGEEAGQDGEEGREHGFLLQGGHHTAPDLLCRWVSNNALACARKDKTIKKIKRNQRSVQSRKNLGISYENLKKSLLLQIVYKRYDQNKGLSFFLLSVEFLLFLEQFWLT